MAGSVRNFRASSELRKKKFPDGRYPGSALICRELRASRNGDRDPRHCGHRRPRLTGLPQLSCWCWVGEAEALGCFFGDVELNEHCRFAGPTTRVERMAMKNGPARSPHNMSRERGVHLTSLLHLHHVTGPLDDPPGG